MPSAVLAPHIVCYSESPTIPPGEKKKEKGYYRGVSTPTFTQRLIASLNREIRSLAPTAYTASHRGEQRLNTRGGFGFTIRADGIFLAVS